MTVFYFGLELELRPERKIGAIAMSGFGEINHFKFSPSPAMGAAIFYNDHNTLMDLSM